MDRKPIELETEALDAVTGAGGSKPAPKPTPAPSPPPSGGFRGGVKVAVGDLDGDG